MLRIRFSRTGKTGQPSFRIVIAEHRSPVKGRAIGILGHYQPTGSKKTVIDQEKIAYWISKGAIPSDSVAAFFKKQGMANMDRYLSPRNKKREKKGEKGQKQAVQPQQAQPTAPAPAA